MEPVKNKKLTYLLICAVAVVWGIVVYRVFFNETEEETFALPKTKTVHEPYDQYTAKNDTAKLVLNYRDPFTGAAIQPVRIISSGTVTQKRPRPVVQGPSPVNWAAVSYSGYMVNPSTKKTVAIMTVNGVERMLSEGESLQGLKLLKNKKDSVLVSWMGKQKYIRQ